MFDFLRGFWWYDFQDDNIKPEFTESNYGLIRPDTTLKESAYVVADLSRLIRRGKFVRRLPVADRKLWLLQYELDGKDVLAAFHTYPEDDFKIVLENASETLPPVSVRHAGRAPLPRNWGYRDWLRKGQPECGNRLSITVRDMPVLLEGDLSRVTVAEVEKRDFPRFAAAPPPLPEPEFSVAALPVGTSGGMTPVNGYRPLNNSGPRCPEFAAEFMVRYDARNLYLTAVVTDRSFFCDQPVEDAACLLGVDQVHIDRARLLDGFQNRPLGDFVEDDALGPVDGETQHFGQVPCDGFSFAVLIGGEPDGLRLGQLREFVDHFLLVAGDFVYGLVAFSDIDAEILLRKVADVSEARFYDKVLAEKLLDGLGLGGGLYDY